MFASNPFFNAFIHADLLGKLIFLGLLILSILSWVIIIHKVRLNRCVKDLAKDFSFHFQKNGHQPLNIQYSYDDNKEFPHPFHSLYNILRKSTVAILNKNRSYAESQKKALPEGASYLCTSDIELIESHLTSAISQQIKGLEKNLFLLATVVTLAPFLGLLGTVWGILTTFSELQTHAAGNTNQMVMQGLSLALATTVLGLIDAIPALIGYNYLKNSFREFQTEMADFSNNLLSAVEIHYRKVNI